MFLQLLAFWHRLTLVFTAHLESWKHSVRTWIGPEPQRYSLLQDGRVLPATLQLPTEIQMSTFVYDPATHRIEGAVNADPAARYRRLPLIAGSLQHTSIGTIDISDWLGEIRAHPVPDLPIRQILTLWSLVHNQYFPLSDGAQATITKNDGETDLITFD
jgi:hypothetical protein